jgi:hypothetical protein
LFSLLAIGILPAITAAAPSRVHPLTVPAASGPWLDRFNAWRANARVSSLTENPVWSQGDVNHSIYMVKNNSITHYETVGAPYYTTDGDAAGRNSNIYVSSSISTQDVQAIDFWMQAPFHALAMVDPRLSQTGFGSFREATAGWSMGASVDVLHGNSLASGQFSAPVFFPGNGSTQPLRTYGGGESPDPLQGNCAGYAAPTGLPVFVELGGNIATTAGPVHTFTSNGVPLEHCILDSSAPNVGSNLTYRGGVVLIPRQPLQDGVTYTVTLTVNGLPYTWSFTVGAFAIVPPIVGWQSLGGVLTSSPAASASAAIREDVFARGTDGALWQKTWNGTAWGQWQPLGGGLTSAPGAVSMGANRTDLFVRGTDNQLWQKTWNGTAWGQWQPLGGVLTSGPDVSSWGANRLDVFVRGSDNQLWHKWSDGLTWYPWEPLGGALTSDPTAVAWGFNRIDVFARGTDMQMWHRVWNGVAWQSWEPLGGGLTSGPQAASCASGRLDVFVVGTDSGLWRKGFNGTWGQWQPMGGQWTSDPGAVCRPATTTIDMFARATDNALWTGSVTGS